MKWGIHSATAPSLFGFNSALLFDGINDYVTFPAVALTTAHDWTIQMWLPH